jgi:hypothetical protein
MMYWLWIAWNQYRDYRINKLMTDDIENAWENLRLVWSRASVVYRGPIGFSATIKFEYALLESFIKKFPKTEDLFYAALLDPNPFISAYSLVALEKLHSRYLNRLPKKLFNREEEIEWKLAGRGDKNKLKQFAEIHKLL